MKNRIFIAVCLTVMGLALVWILYVLCYKSKDIVPLPVSSQFEEETQVPEALTSMSVDKYRVDFGDVVGDTLLQAKFTLRNSGENDLVIHYVNPDCHCTGYSLSKNVIAPSDTASLVLKFDTAGKVYEQKIVTTLSANTPDQMYRFTIKANVIR